jgi:Skp family chaperone for outer membrane proteins
MTKRLILSVGFIAAAFVLSLTTRALTQGQNALPLPKTKIAIVNLRSMVRGYERWTAFEAQYKVQYKGYEDQFEARKARGLALKAELGKVASNDPKADSIKKELRGLDFEVQSIGDEATTRIGKMKQEMCTLIYREIEEAVKAYARANDVELVMQYNDGVGMERDDPANIDRKMQSGSMIPIYSTPGMDISETIVLMLNAHYKQAARNSGAQR